MINKALVFLFLFSNIINSQSTNDFFGVIKLNDSIIIPYSVFFDINNDKIRGFSITDSGGDHETKSEISGTYDATSRTILFKETSILYTKSEIIKQNFCFINFESNNFKMNSSTVLKGKFRGLFSDGSECVNGEINMKRWDKLQKETNKLTKRIKRTKRIKKLPDSLKNSINLSKQLDTLKMNVLRVNQKMSLFTKSNEVVLSFFDRGQIDGDIITIYVNEKKILNNHTLTKNKKSLSLMLNSKSTKVVIKADSAGSITINTANIEINDGTQFLNVVTSLKTGESTTINIIKK
ncbi:hypothetical protein OAD49_05575 [Flavobacteriaceae bacterium]|nr:hypothetical protein [Flavobacteriaceae bacterium]